MSTNCSSELITFKDESNKKYNNKGNTHANFYLVRSKTPMKTITQNHNNQKFYYKNNFYIEFPQEKRIKPEHLDREKLNLYNFKFQNEEGAMEEHNSNLFLE